MTSLATDLSYLAAIVENSSDAIISKDLDGTIRSWNHAAERLFGWTADEMIGQTIRRIIPDDRQGEEDAILARVLQGDLIPKFQTVRLSCTGDLIPIAVTVSPIRDEHGTIVGASKIANDLRQREELRETNTRFAALADNIPQLAWIADGEGWIFWYNRRWYDFTGTTLEEMEGWGWQAVHHPDHIDRVTAHFRQALASGEPWEDTFPLRRHDGQFRWFLSRANPVRNAEGAVTLWCGTNTDVTDQREASERIALLMQEVNHRARNMLATIQAIINRSAGMSGADLTQSLKARIRALAHNQELLNGGDWSGARIVDIVATQTMHVVEGAADRVRIDGPPDVILKATPAEALGLAIHELATNATKYGALQVPEGHVEIEWALGGDEIDPMLVIVWRERGGPPVEEPSRTGFGSILIRRNMEQVFGGPVTMRWAPDGLEWQVEARAGAVIAETVESIDTHGAFGPYVAPPPLAH